MYDGPVKRALPFLLFAALTLAVFWRFLLFGHTLYAVNYVETRLGRPDPAPRAWFRASRPHARVADGVLLLPPIFRVYNEGLKAGELRLWNPHLFGGYPLYADPMAHPFYPPTRALHAALPPETAYEIGLMLHFFFSGAAMYWALLALKRSPAAAVAGGVFWMLCGCNAMWFSTGILAGASVFGPLTLLWLARARERRDAGCAALAAAAMGMTILGSHPQHALYIFIFFVAWLAVAAIRDRENRGAVLQLSAIFATVSIGIGLVEILARLDTIANGFRRAALPLDADAATLLGIAIGKAWFPENPVLEYEFAAYTGACVLALAAFGAVRRFREARYFVIFAAAALLLAFFPPLAAMLRGIPVLGMSPPSRWMNVFSFCAAVLAAAGVDAARENPRPLPLVLSAATAAFLLACLAKIGPLSLSDGAAIETALGFALAAAAAFAALRRPRLALGLGLAAILFELLPFFLLFNNHADAAVLRETPEAIRSIPDREPWRGAGTLGTSGETAELSYGNNLLAIYGVETPGGFEAIAPAHFARFCLEAGGLVSASGRSLVFNDFGSPLLDAAGLKYVFLPSGRSPGKRFRPAGRWGYLRLYENAAVLPRAFMVSGVLAARDEEDAARLLHSPAFRPRETVVLQGENVPSRAAGLVEHRIAWIERTPDRLKLEVAAKADGFLVLSDTDYPGWEASVDGRDEPILRANLAFRAVAVPAGTHAVEFRFRPDSARRGPAASAAFLLLALVFAWKKRSLIS